MKIGMRKPSVKKSFTARTTGAAKRKAKSAVNPFYGKKGSGWLKNPRKAAYNKIYNKTTFRTLGGGLFSKIILFPLSLALILMKIGFFLMYVVYKYIFIGTAWLFVRFVRIFKKDFMVNQDEDYDYASEIEE